jgi:hypothetical protein
MMLHSFLNSLTRLAGLLAFITAVSLPAHLNAGTTPLQIAIVNSETIDPDDPAAFYEQLLRLALEKTRKTDGDFVIVHKPNAEGVGRVRAMLVANTGIDVIWSSVTQERKAAMQVVPYNLLRGLNDYRVLLIRTNSQPKFTAIKNLNDLRRMTAGSGQHWNDTQVLRANDIPVVTSISYTALFKMLAAERFDFIACGMHEIDFATKTFGNLGLEPEQTLLLHYDKPTHYSFFVNKGNYKLADRILRGLIMAEADGSIDRAFNQFAKFKQRLEETKTSSRLRLELKNPTSDQ